MNLAHFEHALESPESEYLDFKREYPRNKAELVHDILCLANALHSKHRYLIFGVEDKTKIIAGVQNDQNRLTTAKILDIFANAKINHLPEFKLQTHSKNGNEIDVLVIRNTRNKPYRVLHDYTYEGVTLRAGVVYCRNGDRNTPTNGTATDAEIKLMYMEGMGLNLTPSERFDLYLKDTAGWKNADGRDPPYFFYEQHPEFQIIKHSARDFDEEWVRVFPDPNAHLIEYSLNYLGVGLAEAHCVICDGGRFYTLLPKRIFINYASKEYCAYYLIDKGRNGSLRRLFDTQTVASRHYLNMPLFPNDRIAKEELTKDLNAGATSYPFFIFNEVKRVHQKFFQNALLDIQQPRNRRTVYG